MVDYPRIVENGRRPNKERDGSKDYGKPCVICGTGTVGSKWIQVSWFRGDDEEVRLCAEHYKLPAPDIIKASGWGNVEHD